MAIDVAVVGRVRGSGSYTYFHGYRHHSGEVYGSAFTQYITFGYTHSEVPNVQTLLSFYVVSIYMNNSV